MGERVPRRPGVFGGAVLAVGCFFWGNSAGLASAQTGLRVEIEAGAQQSQRVGKDLQPIQVKVLDAMDRAVPNAVISIEPGGAKGGSFVSKTTDPVDIVRTDTDGRAVIKGLRANNLTGPYDIRIRASYFGKTGQPALPVRSLNTGAPKTKRTVLLVVAAAAAATITGVLLTRPVPPKATISTVTPTGGVGAPTLP